MRSLLAGCAHRDEPVEIECRRAGAKLHRGDASRAHACANLDIQARQPARERQQRFVHLLHARQYDRALRERQDEAVKDRRGDRRDEVVHVSPTAILWRSVLLDVFSEDQFQGTEIRILRQITILRCDWNAAC